MKEIDHRNVETYVRSFISESFDLQTKRSIRKAEQRDGDVTVANSSITVKHKVNQEELKEGPHGRAHWNSHKNRIR